MKGNKQAKSGLSLSPPLSLSLFTCYLRNGSNCSLTRTHISQNILASNWQGNLNTIKADSKGSKEKICTSKVKYSVKKGRPSIWVPEKGLHNVDAFMLSVDQKGFDVLGKVLRPVKIDGSREYQRKESRFTFKDEAHDLRGGAQECFQFQWIGIDENGMCLKQKCSAVASL
ncbi:uncharacterized protein LOC130756489 [Actinidia eriantha]|uniref:uncharacterized protein LOC130756489 n=1 Tax=Actinidia eriantha TaxID=165200 RepID=UPI002585407D|nr:uncharacterized protein LOC130756489 [Actinidia eriantha]